MLVVAMNKVTHTPIISEHDLTLQQCSEETWGQEEEAEEGGGEERGQMKAGWT